MKFIDINCDMGEERGDDKTIIKYISSANIACGGHAGSVEIMKKTISLALEHGVGTGAHPGYPDKPNFGRLDINMDREELCKIILEQINIFKMIAVAGGSVLSHIKLHGALYNKAAGDYDLMRHIIENIHRDFGSIPVYTLSGSISEKAVSDAKGIFLRESFADRAYNEDGSLVSRKISGAVICDKGLVAERVLHMVNLGRVNAISGRPIAIKTDTVCVHGDTEGSVQMAISINKKLKENGIGIRRGNAL